jgi:hypothetical protein
MPIRPFERLNLTIDRLQLQLPAGFEHRADSIARRLVEELARLAWSESASAPQVNVPAQTVQPVWSDQQIAMHLAVALQAQIMRQRG